MNRRPELLAPAGGTESLTAALRCGADAVYVGAEQFSARANAENFSPDALREAANRCHIYGAKLYLAVNTLIFDREFSALDALLETAAEIGADGCIVQDLGAAAYIAKRLPTLRLHASTQLTIHSPAGVRFAKQAGFCRVVAARELSREQLSAVCAEARRCDMEVEAFVHGAHCMSVSGQCWMSAAMGGRSANRGCCAQPCRLPFSADPHDPDYCALSLKDMSLVRHLLDMAEIGVDSLKIEGRMKRPEYVAAAVTACRLALNGEQPDLDELRAVFSRSGFTDGYYAGKRRDMFGTRQKEDVTAAQGVLQQLREKYQKPHKCAVLNAHFVLPEKTQSLLTVSDGGRSVIVAGEVPQQAKSRPTDLPMLQKQFDRLGDTIYTAGQVTAEIAEGVMLPASALNAMRRKACEEMDRCRILENSTQHTDGKAPELPKAEYVPEKPAFRLQIRRLEQLAEIGDLADGLEYLMLPLHLAEAYLQQEQPVSVSRCMLVPPRFICNEEKIAGMLKNAKERGFSHLACGHAADVQLGKEYGFTLHGTLGLHTSNSFAADVLHQYGLQDALCSPEASELPAQVLPLGCFAYGRLPLMLMRNCPIQAQVGCKACRHTLTDRKGAAVYTDCTRMTDSPDYAELFNAVPVWTADKPEFCRKYAFSLLYMTDEDAERTADILRAYVRGTRIPAPEPYTRGIKLQAARKPQGRT